MIGRLIDAVRKIIKQYHLDVFLDVALFMIILLFFHFVWRYFIREILSVEFISNSAIWLARQVYFESRWVIDVLGVNVTPFDELIIGGGVKWNVFYHAENHGYVSVNSSCSGLKQFYQWFFLMILFPGPWKQKLWFIPSGLVIIHVVNVFRIVTMVYVTIYFSQYWDFIHDWVLRPLFYVVMFMLWVWWNEKYYLKGRFGKRKKSNG